MSTEDKPTLYSLITPSKLSIIGGPNSEELIKKELSRLAKEEELDNASSTITRKEQTLLRKVLVGGHEFADCAICGKQYPIDFLVAAHLKKRSKCTDKERLDINNIAKLMCKFGCDDLYEKGYIYLDNGRIHTKQTRKVTPDLKLYIENLEGKYIAEWKKSAKYFQWHKENVSMIKTKE
jgi:DNA repair exonuclease SbcCD nuclease subunit